MSQLVCEPIPPGSGHGPSLVAPRDSDSRHLSPTYSLVNAAAQACGNARSSALPAGRPWARRPLAGGLPARSHSPAQRRRWKLITPSASAGPLLISGSSAGCTVATPVQPGGGLDGSRGKGVQDEAREAPSRRCARSVARVVCDGCTDDAGTDAGRNAEPDAKSDAECDTITGHDSGRRTSAIGDAITSRADARSGTGRGHGQHRTMLRRRRWLPLPQHRGQRRAGGRLGRRCQLVRVLAQWEWCGLFGHDHDHERSRDVDR